MVRQLGLENGWMSCLRKLVELIAGDGTLYHVTSRGNAREPIFITDTNRVLFFDILKKKCKNSRIGGEIQL